MFEFVSRLASLVDAVQEFTEALDQWTENGNPFDTERMVRARQKLDALTRANRQAVALLRVIPEPEPVAQGAGG